VSFSPKTRATVVSLLVLAPFMFVRIRYDYALSQRTWIYIWLPLCLTSALIYQWVYHRYSAAPLPHTLPPAELNLVREHIPALVWTALVPPAILLALLWWVTLHGSGLPWRDGWLGPPKPAVTHQMYLPTMIMAIAWISLASWKVVYHVARWHGMPRTYPHRRERLVNAVGLQWISLPVIVAWASGNNFYLPAPIATACAITLGIGMFPLIAYGSREYKLRNQEPHTGTWWYFDRQDPAFLGPRGMNLANWWAFVLVAAGLAPILLAELLYHHAQS
jgi:hypothetical protein